MLPNYILESPAYLQEMMWSMAGGCNLFLAYVGKGLESPDRLRPEIAQWRLSVDEKSCSSSGRRAWPCKCLQDTPRKGVRGKKLAG